MDVSDIFYFFRLGGGEGGVLGDRDSGGVGFLLKIPGGGEGGARGPRGCLQGIWGGGGLNNFFFRGRNSQKVRRRM